MEKREWEGRPEGGRECRREEGVKREKDKGNSQHDSVCA